MILRDAGLRLLKEHLAERTWGNISLRLNLNRFAITPSGKLYSELTPDDIAVVSIDNLSHSGSAAPSSEKELHSRIYERRPNVNAVIHTHQLYASIVSALSRGAQDYIIARTARRALSGTSKLALLAAKYLGQQNSVLLANHGAVCVGGSIEDAFEEALKLEERCREFLEKHIMEKVSESSSAVFDIDKVRQFYLAKVLGRGLK